MQPQSLPTKWRPIMVRRILSDSQWARVASLLPGKDGDPGRSARDNREFLEAVLWIARTGSPWRDLPDEFGLWNSVFQRFRRWTLKGIFERVFKELSVDADFEYVLIDGTIVRLHHPSTALRTAPGQKGDPKPSDWSLARGSQHQNQRDGRCAWQFGGFCAAAGSATRFDRRCALA